MAVLVIGTVLTAFAVPWLTARINDRKLINDARLQKCSEILKKSTDVEAQINGMDTTLELFIKHHSVAPKFVPAQQDQLRTNMEKQYADFDREAWWWYSQLATEATLLRLDVSTESINGFVKAYQKSLQTSTDALQELWQRCLKPDYKPGDPANLKTALRVRQTLHNARLDRAKRVGDLLLQFKPMKPVWFSF